MGRPGSTHAKRQREQARQERSQEKAARRTARKEDEEGRPVSIGGEDPDIAGIVPGPQPPREDDDF